jgi:hypothetical protein
MTDSFIERKNRVVSLFGKDKIVHQRTTAIKPWHEHDVCQDAKRENHQKVVDTLQSLEAKGKILPETS